MAKEKRENSRFAWLFGNVSYFFQIAMFSSLAYIFYFHVTWVERVNPGTDDGCYLARMAGFLGIDQGRFCVDTINYFAPGGPLIWTPFAFVGVFFSRVLGGTALDGAAPFVAHFSFCLLGVSLFLVLRILGMARFKSVITEKRRFFIAMLVILSWPLLYYTTARPLMVHSIEVVLSLTLVLALYQNEMKWALAALVALCLTRYNDIPAVLLPLGYIIDNRSRLKPTRFQIALVAGLMSLSAGAGVWLAFFKGYGPLKLTDVLVNLQWHDVVYFFSNPQFGMIWVSIWWVSAFALGIRFFFSFSYFPRACFLWMLSNALLCVLWKSVGGDYAYRYLSGTCVAGLVIWLECMKLRPDLRKSLVPIAAVNSLITLWLCFIFKTTPYLGYLIEDPGGVLESKANQLF